METTCQASYPLNSENASPPGTFTVYLSWADMALPPKALRSAGAIAIVRTPLLFITSSSFARASDRRLLRKSVEVDPTAFAPHLYSCHRVYLPQRFSVSVQVVPVRWIEHQPSTDA